MKTKVIAAIALSIALSLTAHAQVPGIINYQGRVSVSGTNFNGTGQFAFALVDGGADVSVQATAFASSFDNSGGIVIITVGNPGAGYTSIPNVTITDSTGTGAVAIADIDGGMVTNIEVLVAGANYTSSPTITIDAPPPTLVYNTFWSNDGSSAGGSQTVAAVSLTVTKGLYSVLLGDTTISNMTGAVPASVFANNNVNLRVWFNDGVHGFQQLSPDQRIAAAGYALMAANVPDASITSDKIANSAVTSSQIAGGAVGPYQIAAGAVNAFQIGNGEVVKSLNGLMDAVTLSAGANITLTPSGNNIQIDATGGGGGTPNDNPNTIMSRDGNGNTAVSDLLAIRLNVGTGNTLNGSQASIAGGQNNTASGTASFVGGGINNTAGDQEATVGGGAGNSAGGPGATVGGGGGNIASAQYATVGGGNGNSATYLYATVGGGGDNIAETFEATVGGGGANLAGGSAATVPGGVNNTAGGDYSFAAGRRAKAHSQGDFVWADSQNADFASTANDQVSFRCNGGVRFTSGGGAGNQTVSWTPGSGAWSFTSDRNAKEHFEPLDVQAILAKVAQLPLTEWSYKGYADRHVGPMAQDFHAAFPFNPDDKMLNSADLAGVSLAAIQGLNEKIEQQRSELQAKQSQIDDLRGELNELKSALHLGGK